MNDSAIALSALEPILPIDWRTPSRRQVAWKAEEVYCLPWSLLSRIRLNADRETQFTSGQLYQVCQELGIDQPMGRTRVCFDNAMAESFWSTLKAEFYDRRKWKTRNAARQAVARWIETFYNRRHRHSPIGNQPPVDFENAYHQAATAADENAA